MWMNVTMTRRDHPVRVFNELLTRIQSIIHVIGKKGDMLIQYNRVYIKNDFFLNTKVNIRIRAGYFSQMMQKVIGIANIWVVSSKVYTWSKYHGITADINFTAAMPRLYADYFRG